MTLAQVIEFSLRFGPAIIHGTGFTAVPWMIVETDVQYLRFAPSSGIQKRERNR
ncbi:hypothetical protein DFH08DRAFT_934431, partial [Mycena albidolilacea]